MNELGDPAPFPAHIWVWDKLDRIYYCKACNCTSHTGGRDEGRCAGPSRLPWGAQQSNAESGGSE